MSPHDEPGGQSGVVSASCPKCAQSIQAPGHDLTVMVRCPRCRVELRLSEIIEVSTPMPAEVIPGTSLKAASSARAASAATSAAIDRTAFPSGGPTVRGRAPVPSEAFPSAPGLSHEEAARLEGVDAEETVSLDPLPRKRPAPPPPPPSRRSAASAPVDRTVLDPGQFLDDANGRPLGAPLPQSTTLASPHLAQANAAAPYFPQAPGGNPDATAFQRPVDLDSTAPMSRPPATAIAPQRLPPPPAPPPPAHAFDDVSRAASMAAPRTSEASSPPPDEGARGAADPLEERFAQMNGGRLRLQFQFVVAVVASGVVAIAIDAVLGTGPFFRTLASLFAVLISTLWLLIVSASRDEGPGGLGNALSAWRVVVEEKPRFKTFERPARLLFIGRAFASIGAPLAIGFELLRFLQLSFYGFFGVGSGSAMIFNVLSSFSACAALFGLLLMKRAQSLASADANRADAV